MGFIWREYWTREFTNRLWLMTLCPAIEWDRSCFASQPKENAFGQSSSKRFGPKSAEATLFAYVKQLRHLEAPTSEAVHAFSAAPTAYILSNE